MIQRICRVSALIAALCALLLLPGLAGAQGATATPPPRVEVNQAVAHSVTGELKHMTTVNGKGGDPDKPLLRIPKGQQNRQTDPVIQNSPGATVSVSGGLSFAGVGAGDYGFQDQYAPPDTNMAVGDTQVVQWVNADFAIFDKSTGEKVLGPLPGSAVFQDLGGGCAANNDGDPIVQYDNAAHRWIMTQFSVTDPATYHYLQCVAVSTSSDATGAWNVYAFDYGTTQFPDYPKLGVWPDAYYISYNIFNNASTWAGAKVCAFDRAAMLAGGAATEQCFQLSTDYDSLLPADLDGSTPPPAGSPGLYLNYGVNSLNLWQFHVDFASPANTTLTGPITIGVSAFNPACGGGTCIPQPGTRQQLDSLADRLMYRLAYRNFGDHEALVVNHSVNGSSGQSGIRWYELRNPAGSTLGQATGSNKPVVYQQGTFAPDANSRWMGSIAMDHIGDIAVGYSVSSSKKYPSIAFTGRTPSDAKNTMEAETTIKAGSGSQLRNLSRWGDYSAMRIDPSDDCTFWYTNEYLRSSGTFNWSTWIYSFKFPGCSGTVTAPGAPSGLGATAMSSSEVDLSWTESPNNATSFTVQRSTDNGTTWPFSVTLGATTSSYQDTGLSASTTYSYRVNASNSAGTSAWTGPVSATTQGAPTIPAAPSGLTASAVSSSEIDLSWSDNANNEDGFYVQRSPHGTNSWDTIKTLGANVASYNDTGLVASTAYDYQIIAYNSAGNSSPSNTASATTQAAPTVPAAPSNLTAAALSKNKIQLSWSDNSDNETGFVVQRSSDGANSWSQIAMVSANTTTYTNSGLSRNATYYYRVYAYNSAGNSVYSNTASVQTPSR